MLPAYLLKIEITAKNITIDEERFRELLAPSLNHLDALMGAFDRKPSTQVFYPPYTQDDNSEWWSARGVVMISLGKNRAEYLIQLYQAIVHLIELELPDFEVQAEISKFQFS